MKTKMKYKQQATVHTDRCPNKTMIPQLNWWSFWLLTRRLWVRNPPGSLQILSLSGYSNWLLTSRVNSQPWVRVPPGSLKLSSLSGYSNWLLTSRENQAWVRVPPKAQYMGSQLSGRVYITSFEILPRKSVDQKSYFV